MPFKRGEKFVVKRKGDKSEKKNCLKLSPPPPPYGNLLFEEDYQVGVDGGLIKLDVWCVKGVNTVNTEFNLK